MKTIIYLLNQYPSPSHTFIRREIAALENIGHPIVRVALRGWDRKLIDPADIAEQSITSYVLKSGGLSLVFASLCIFLKNPRSFYVAARFCLRRVSHSDRPSWLHFIYLLEACWIVRKLQPYGEPHFHAHFGTNAAELATLVHLLSGLPYSFTIHGPEEFDHPEALALREKAHFSKFLVAISNFTKSQINRWLEFSDWDKVHVIRCGVDAAYIDPPPNIEGNPKRFICIARLAAQKGQLLLLDAVAKVRMHHPDVELRLVGDGDMRPSIEEHITRLQLQQNVTLLGWASEELVREEILGARALVLPSFAEGLPMVIMEALALGRPVLTTYIAGIPELVRDQIEGWLFPAGSVEAIASAMLDCLAATPQRLLAMGQEGRSRVLEMHDSDRNGKALSEAIEMHRIGDPG